MLTALKKFLKYLLIPSLYTGGIITMIITIFVKAEWGLYLLTTLIPQPNLWYKFLEYPMGKDFLDLLFLSIILGIFIQKKVVLKTPNAVLIFFYIALSYMALWNSTMNFSLPLPVSSESSLFLDWKNYAQMIAMYFLVVSIAKKEEHQKIIVLIISLTILFISIRSFRNFTGGESFQYDKRAGGPFESVGLGANHFGAFIADYCAVFLALFFFEKDWKRKLLFLANVVVGLHPLFFSYSRGAYLAAAAAVGFIGIVKKRSLLVLLFILLFSWSTLLPSSVVDRISMTTESEGGELDLSAAHRLDLWDHAINLFKENPVFGVGFGGFAYTVPEGELTDTHNFYFKTLAEQGLIGIILFLFVLIKAFTSGLRLFMTAPTPFQKGLGLGFLGCVISIIVTNFFGDRWSYFMLGSYFWVFWGLTDSCLIGNKNGAAETKDLEKQTA